MQQSLFTSGESADPNSYSGAVSDAQLPDPKRDGGVVYGRSRVSNTSRRSKNRKSSRSRTSSSHRKSMNKQKLDETDPGNADVIDESYFLQRRGKDKDGNDFFRWNGKEYTFPGATRISKTKTTTKTTKISSSRVGTIGTDGKITYKYTIPGEHSETVYSNTTTFSEHNPDTISRIHSTSSSSSYGAGSSANGELFGEDIVYDYVEEEIDPEFAKGYQFTEEEIFHPFVTRGFGYSSGKIGESI